MSGMEKETMRKICLQLPLELFRPIFPHEVWDFVRKLDVIQFFQLGPSKVNSLSRVEMVGEESPKIIEKMTYVDKVEVLYQREHEYYCFLSENTPEILSQFLVGTISVLNPLRVTQEYIEFRIAGTETDISRIFRMLEQLHILCELKSTAPFSWREISIQEILTPKQREVLTATYHLGYYDIPRGISSKILASILGIKKSTFLEHIRNIEKKVIAVFCESYLL